MCDSVRVSSSGNTVKSAEVCLGCERMFFFRKERLRPPFTQLTVFECDEYLGQEDYVENGLVSLFFLAAIRILFRFFFLFVSVGFRLS